MILPIDLNQVLERLRFENPWWSTGKIDAYFDAMPRRGYFKHLLKLVNTESVRRSIVLMGPRRVGKTVMLHHLVQELIQQGVSPQRILFVTIENPVYTQQSLDSLFKIGRRSLGVEENLEGWYVIFDEIQYLKDWNLHLKTLTDSYRGVTFIVSGSAAAALKYQRQESGAGRFTDFMLPPLTFYEFIEMQKLGHLVQKAVLSFGKQEVEHFKATDIRELNKRFVDYINYGGYPEAIFSESVRNNPERFIRNDVVDKVLLRDLPGLYGIQNVQELNALFTTIAYNSANEFSLEALSKQSGVPKNTLKKYIEYLEAAFLIRIVKRIDQTGKRFQRDNFFKIFLTNPALRAALFSPLQAHDQAMGSMTESAIFAQWMHRTRFIPWYARWANGEVDMVGLSPETLKPVWALEIKWSDRYAEKPNELKSLIKFCQENKLKKALVTTMTVDEVRQVNDLAVYFVPAAAYAYTVGYRTLLPENE